MYGHVRRARRCVTAAAGLTGVVVAHAGAYVLAFSDPRQRAHVLSATGHGYWSAAVWLALMGAVVVVAAVMVRGATGAGAPGAGAGRLVPRVGTLAAWQAAVFTTVEVLERLGAGAPVGELAHGHEFVIGLGLQLAVAAALVALLGAVEHLGVRVARAFTRARPARRDSVHHRRRPVAPARPAPTRRPRSRAPPVAAVSIAC